MQALVLLVGIVIIIVAAKILDSCKYNIIKLIALIIALVTFVANLVYFNNFN